jgi:hypothetical protein
VANEFRRSGLVDEDAETWRPVVGYSVGLSDGTEAFAELPLVLRGGGFLDPFIEWWHYAVISQPVPDRRATPEGRSVVSFPGGGPFGSAFSLGDLTIGAARRYGGFLVARVAAKVPTGNAAQLAGSGAFDAGAALDWRVRMGRAWTLDLNGSLVFQGPATDLDGARRTVYSSAIAVTWAANGGEAWTVQWSAEQFPTKTGLDRLDKDHRVMTIGYQRRLMDGTVFQAYLSEDADWRWTRFSGGATIGPDLTIGARLVKRL